MKRSRTLVLLACIFMIISRQKTEFFNWGHLLLCAVESIDESEPGSLCYADANLKVSSEEDNVTSKTYSLKPRTSRQFRTSKPAYVP